ncbi:MAG: oligosaccharide flippase family protein [Candidatus Spechtbacteria bacterium]|nr:oligosaccharide flippase family protein [Candidatus Spechtbacteria bacterium]
MSTNGKIYQILRYTQKYTGTDNVYLAHGGFWLTLQKLASFLSILSAIAFANLLSKEVYGTYQYVLSIAAILAIPTLQSMKAAITQAVARGYEGSLYPAFWTKIKWSLIGSLASLGMAAFYFFRSNPTLGYAFLVVALLLPLLNPFSLYASYLEGKKSFKLLSIYAIASTVISIAAIILIVYLTKNVPLIIFGDFAIQIAVSAFFFRIVTKKFPPNKARDEKTIPFGTRVSFIKIIPTIARELDQVLIWHFLGPAQVAIYAFAQKIPNQISDNLSVLNQIAFPKMSALSKEELRQKLPKKVLRLYAFVIPLTILYLLLIPFVFHTFFPRYQDTILYAQAFSFFIFLFPLSFVGQTFDAKMQEKNIFLTSVFSPLIRITLLIILTPIFGLWGVVLTRLINSVATNTLGVFLFLKK